jgi:HEAT repeat protein/cyclophilin family peptidyl-prolyl cis-trans isomerase
VIERSSLAVRLRSLFVGGAGPLGVCSYFSDALLGLTPALMLALMTAACASAPSAPPSPPPPLKPAGPTFEQKMAWILRLEDQRVLREPPSAPPPSSDQADLARLLADSEARVRRRAALAVGRVGLRDGVEALLPLLGDADPDVRQMAAFALGLIGDPRARDPLVQALSDPSPLVQGSAAEGLGLIGDRTAAEPIGKMIAQVVATGGLDAPPGDDGDGSRDTPAGAFRLGMFALARLKAFEPIAAAVLDAAGRPRVRWWPVAFALQRLEDPRALNALLALATDTQPYTRAFAVKGLGVLKDRAAMPILLPLVSGADRTAAIEAARALGRIGDPAAAPSLLKIVQDRKAEPTLRLEAVAAVGRIRTPAVYDVMLDLLSDPSPDIRSAALGSSAALDPEHFVAVLSGLDPDPNWSVRFALASVLGTLPPEIAIPRLSLMLNDSDQRVVPSVLASLVKLRAPTAPAMMIERLKADDPAVRAAAAAAVGELKPASGAAALAAAYELGQRDPTYIARAAALAALVKYGAADALPVLRTALSDKDWAVRVRAAALLNELDASGPKEVDRSGDVVRQIRPAPTRLAPDAYAATGLVSPPVSTEVFLDTDRGAIQIELAVLDAPLTVENFLTLARSGFFNGLSVHRVVPNYVIQTGDPRGDGEGGPNYTIRDELNERPFVRGTVGMALDWADTGGSQFFITYSPQPQLDAKYTVFGRVIAGMEVVDAIQPRDVIRGVRVWDGTKPQ